MKTRKKSNFFCCCVPNSVAYTAIGLLSLIIISLLLVYRSVSSVPTFKTVENALTSTVEAKKLESFVNQAADLVAQEGTKAFPEFRKKGGQWWKGDQYVFVYNLSGKTLVLPPQPALEGINRLNTKDSGGVYFVREMIDQLKTKNSGWLQYAYPKPGAAASLPKLSYFKKVAFGGEAVLVGSGIYLK